MDSSLQQLQAWATVAATAVAALTLAALVWYTIETHRLRIAAERQSKAAISPDVSVYVVPSRMWLNFINMEIANFGFTPAHNIRLHANPDFEYRKGEFISQLGPFKNGINHLPPGGKVVFFLGSVMDFKAAGRMESSFRALTNYQDRHGATFSHEYEISFKFLEGLSSIERDPAITIADDFESLRKAVETWSSEAIKEIDRNRWKQDSYFYRSPIGVFWIRPMTGRVGRYQLGIDSLPLHEHYSLYEAAEAVHQKKTGYSLWDNRQDVETPADLTKWTVEGNQATW